MSSSSGGGGVGAVAFLVVALFVAMWIAEQRNGPRPARPTGSGQVSQQDALRLFREVKGTAFDPADVDETAGWLLLREAEASQRALESVRGRAVEWSLPVRSEGDGRVSVEPTTLRIGNRRFHLHLTISRAAEWEAQKHPPETLTTEAEIGAAEFRRIGPNARLAVHATVARTEYRDKQRDLPERIFIHLVQVRLRPVQP